jgi:hypothetical protein
MSGNRWATRPAQGTGEGGLAHSGATGHRRDDRAGRARVPRSSASTATSCMSWPTRQSGPAGGWRGVVGPSSAAGAPRGDSSTRSRAVARTPRFSGVAPAATRGPSVGGNALPAKNAATLPTGQPGLPPAQLPQRACRSDAVFHRGEARNSPPSDRRSLKSRPSPGGRISRPFPATAVPKSILDNHRAILLRGRGPVAAKWLPMLSRMADSPGPGRLDLREGSRTVRVSSPA